MDICKRFEKTFILIKITIFEKYETYKKENNCSLKKYISEHKYKNYVNLDEFIDNK